MTDSGVIPHLEDRAKCKTCLDFGYIEIDGCTCGAGVPPDGHEPMCGTQPCPEGCWGDMLPP